MPGFLHALSLGVDTLELDVVISADNQVVVSHEPWFSPAICRLPSSLPIPARSEQQHNLYQLPYSAIQQYDCGLTPHPGFPFQQPVAAVKPLLRDVLSQVYHAAQAMGRVLPHFSIEIKSEPAGDGVFHPTPARFLELVMEVVNGSEFYGRTTLLSFDPRILQVAHTRYSSVPLCLLVEDEIPLSAHLAKLGFIPAVYGPRYSLVSAELVATVHALGMRLIPWTVNELETMKALLVLHVDGITTDYPDRLLALLAS
ncbi:glycerophosphodiester phosphodiesterase family protein [Hymenobacter sp. DG25B]|uniref:glycerophosphodiester phosphodiesterase family protein n=1 Tax=Hymenobacter sp. DG25B TaxID=1385664 RepID=UPI001E62C188|nr:glycerophosphodiester phosphodiesterase family protein [Hymenobacter sp. DG25B]